MEKCYVVERWNPSDCQVILMKSFLDKESAEDYLNKVKVEDYEYVIHEIDLEVRSLFEKMGER